MSRVPSPPELAYCIGLNYEPPKHLSGQVRSWMKTLASRLDGRLEVLHGVAMQAPLDGFTVYYDVYGSGCLVTTYEGLDYGHSWFIELRADSEVGLLSLEECVKEVFGSESILGTTSERQGLRDYEY